MTIPSFDANGNLPPGIHNASLLEIRERFVYNSRRRYLFQRLLLLINNLTHANCSKLYLNGSFVTAISLPNDYDACWDTHNISKGIDPILLEPLKPERIKRKYGGDIFPRIPELLHGIDHLHIFQYDRSGNAKGIIAINLLNES